MMTKYELYKKDDYTSLAKVARIVYPNGDQTTIELACAHIKESEYIHVKIAVHDWKDDDDRHAFFYTKTIKEGWAMFRQLLHLYRMEG